MIPRAVALVFVVLWTVVYVVLPILSPRADLLALLVFASASASFSIVGLILLERAPRNRIGELLTLAAALLTVGYGLESLAVVGATARAVWPVAAIAGVIGDSFVLYAIVIALIGIPLVFPDGHLVSPRWRAIVWLAVVAVAAQTVVALTSPDSASFDGLANPLAVPGLVRVTDVLAGFSSATSIIGFGGAAAAVWLRYRRGDRIERQQVKWLLAVAALAAVFFPIAFIVPIGEIGDAAFILGALTLVALPIAIGIAVLRYHLYEIDRIVSRTIAYAVVVGLIGVVFGGGVVLLSTALASFANGQTIAIAGATLVAYAIFQPVLGRVRQAVDRRFDRARYDGERTAEAFAGRLRDETNLAAVTSDLSRTTSASLAPASLGIWLRETGR